MATSIQDLFKYKSKVDIKDEKGEVVTSVWVRILGDHDLSETYRYGRIKSARVRKELRNTDSDEYFAEVAVVEDGNSVDLIELIKQSNQSDFYAQAQSAIDREDVPKIEDFAVDPDAATLEEQEKRDMAELQNELDYQNKLKEYVDTKETELDSRLRSLEKEELIEEARIGLINLRALSAFIEEILDQKVFRGTYTDKECKTRAFSNIDEYINQHSIVKAQLRTAYQELEVNPDDPKKLAEGGAVTIALATHKETGIPFAEDIVITSDLPHTLSYLIMYTHKLSSFNELTKEKQPPRGIWDKPHKLTEFFEEAFALKDDTTRSNHTIEFDPEDVE